MTKVKNFSQEQYMLHQIQLRMYVFRHDDCTHILTQLRSLKAVSLMQFGHFRFKWLISKSYPAIVFQLNDTHSRKY